MASSTTKPAAKQAEKLPLYFRIFFGFLILIFAAAGAVFGILAGYEYNLPKIQSLEDYRPDVITDVYSDDNHVIGELYLERRIIVAHEDIPPYLQLAIIAAEDDQFYEHSGINYFSIIRAVVKDSIKMSYPVGKGASTITQQLSRLLLNNMEKTLDRKIKELLIAWKIEKQYSKQQILTLYCNLHNMGPGIYGVAAAADHYFGKQLKDLTLEECATIAGLPRNPTLYSPHLHPEAALRRRNFVLDRMAAENMISEKLAAEAKAKPLVLKQRTNDDMQIAPYFIEWVRQSLAARYSSDEIWKKGMQIYTTLNIEMQRAAQKALRDGLRNYDKKRGWRGPVDNILKKTGADLQTYSDPTWRKPMYPGSIAIGLVEAVRDNEATVRMGKYRAILRPRDIEWTNAKTPSQILKPGDLAYFKIVSLDDARSSASLQIDQRPDIQGAVVILQNSTGEIKAMVGGYDFESSEFNRATQAMRQVGSTIKPLVYSAAFERGMTPESTIIDAPVSFTDSLGRVWRPLNYDGKFKGQITVREALTESRNIPTIKVASLIGIKNVVIMARRFGLTGPMDPFLPLAIGACEATPLEMASAFTVFPNLGVQARPYFIRRVEDYERVKKEERVPEIRKVLKPDVAEKMLGLLQNVVQNGTATAAKSLGRPLGGKTGTTDEFTDAWFVGFTPSITAAVWVGYDEKKTLGDKQTGAAVALPIWIDCMKEILRDTPVEHFPTTEPANLFVSESPGSTPFVRKNLFIEDISPSESPKP